MQTSDMQNRLLERLGDTQTGEYLRPVAGDDMENADQYRQNMEALRA
jgi:hypothetical protein